MRVREKKIDGLSQSRRSKRAWAKANDNRRWFGQRLYWWWLEVCLWWSNLVVNSEERLGNWWENVLFGWQRTNEDFFLLFERLSKLVMDNTIGMSEKIVVLVRGFQSSVLARQGRFRAVAGFILIIFTTSIISAGVLSYISVAWGLGEGFVQAAEDGMSDVQNGVSALKNGQFDEASEYFARADRNFSEITRNLDNFGQGEGWLGGTMAGDEYENVIHLVDGLQATARGAKFMSVAIESVENYAGQDMAGLLFQMVSGDDADIFPMIDQSRDYFNQASSEINKALMEFRNIDPDLVPADYQELYRRAMDDADRYLNILNGFNSVIANIDVLLGRHYPTKYLLLFQNNNELRPTGGFIGSYGIATFFQGKMTDLYFDDIYNPDGQMLEEITPPYPINLMTNQWGMRDSNWDPDFIQSAQRAALFYEKSGGQTVDGVFAFTPEIVERFLDLTGPVELPDYSVKLTGENFQSEIQREIEIDAMEQDHPKEVLADLLPVLMERLADLPAGKKELLWQTVIDLIEEKQVLIYLSDPEIEQLISQVGWAGEMVSVSPETDYLAMIHANIGGRKSDGFVTETVNHQVKIDDKGEIIVDLTIIRKNADDWNTFNHANFDYLRVYVPAGAQLIAVDGFVNQSGIYRDENNAIWYDESSGEATLATTKVYEEYGKTVFANWIVTNPWEVSTVSYRYKLPFTLGGWFTDSEEYNLYVQKQAGRPTIDYNFSLLAPEWTAINSESDLESGLSVKNDLAKDWSTGWVLKKKWYVAGQ